MRTAGTIYNHSAKAVTAKAVRRDTAFIITPLNDKMTLRDLLMLIDTTTGVSIPTAKALSASGKPIAVYTVPNFSISVYSSGFALAVSYKRTTVVRVDECGDYNYDTLNPDLVNCQKSAIPSHIGSEVFLDIAWPVRVIMTAEDQLERNNNGSAWSKICLHPDIAAYVKEYNRSIHGSSIEDMSIEKIAKEEMLKKMTDKQRKVYILYYDEGYTQSEIAEMMRISQKAVGQHIMLANKKVFKYIAENQ